MMKYNFNQLILKLTNSDYNYINKRSIGSETKSNQNKFYSILNMSLLVYVFYALDRKVSAVKTQVGTVKDNVIESIIAITDSSFANISKQLSQEIRLENATLIEIHLKKMEELKEVLTANHGILIQKTSAKTDQLILKLLDIQATASKSLGAPTVHIYQESSTKPLVIGGLIFLAIVFAGSYFIVPKVAMMTASQWVKFQYFVSEVVRYIPGYNTAEGVFHVDGHPHFKIITEITRGIPYHTVHDTRYDTQEPLSSFIENLLNSATDSSSVTSAVELLVEVSTKTGDVINAGPLIG